MPSPALSLFHGAVNGAVQPFPLASLLYESRAAVPLSDTDLRLLVDSVQARNRREGVTGLLIYERGRFMQWLEGPTDGLGRVWKSIREDPRHNAVTLLADSALPVRFFGNSPMALGKPRGNHDARRFNAMRVNHQIKRRLSPPRIDLRAEPLSAAVTPLEWSGTGKSRRGLPSAPAALNAQGLSTQDWTSVKIDPGLMANPVFSERAEGDEVDSHAAELARLLAADNSGAAFALIDRLRADGRSFTRLCDGLFRPTARALGDLWQSDICNEFEISLGLSKLHVALRKASLATLSADVARLPLERPHSVLVAPMPQEPHLLGSVIASEMFWQAGWKVWSAFPDTQAALVQLVESRWLDVLVLSLSDAFAREHRLTSMAACIHAVRAATPNPGLTVIVHGRVFDQKPESVAAVLADVGSHSARDLYSAALLYRQVGQDENGPTRAFSGAQ